MRIIFTSDTHGSLYPINYAQNRPENTGLFCVAAQIKKDDDTLVLDGGDSLQPKGSGDHGGRRLGKGDELGGQDRSAQG